jgi:DHA3 family macrolide efflux protein-like MFS transporter
MGRFSEQIFLFVMIWYLLTKTHSAFQVGIFLICGTVPAAFISPFSGIIACHYPRLNRLAAINLFRCILVLIIAGSFYYHFSSIWLLDAAAAILALGGAIYNPIHTSTLPNMLTQDQATPAAPEQFWLNMGALSGVLAGGFLYSSSNMPLILIISAIFYMIAALLECWLPSQTSARPTTTDGIGYPHALREGFTYLTGHRELFFMTGFFFLANLLFWPILMIVFPYLFKTVFKLSSLEFGLAQGAFWAGVVIGVAVITSGPAKERLSNTLLKNYICIGILMFLLALPLLPLFKTGLTVWSVTMIDIILAVCLGLVTAAVNLRIGAFVRDQLDNDFRDRIWEWLSSAMAVTGSVGLFIGGWLSHLIPIYWLFSGGAMGFLLIIAIIAWMKRLWKI